MDTYALADKTYSQKYMDFISEREECVRFKEIYPNVIENMNALYIKMFQIMDIAKGQNIPCLLKDIINTVPGMNVIINNLLEIENMKDNFDGLIAEMQDDVDLILEHGFIVFEEKIINLFVEIEEEDNKIKNLIKNISKISKDISNQVSKMS